MGLINALVIVLHLEYLGNKTMSQKRKRKTSSTQGYFQLNLLGFHFLSTDPKFHSKLMVTAKLKGTMLKGPN